MARRLDTTMASSLITEVDGRLAALRRYLVPPHQPVGGRQWFWSEKTLDENGFQYLADEMVLYLGITRLVRVRLLTRMFDHGEAGTGIGGLQ